MYHLLLVNENPDVLTRLQQSISWDELGFERIDHVTNSEQAMRLMDECYYEIVITDTHIKPFNGFSLFRWISQQHQNTQVIFLVNRGKYPEARIAFQSGAIDYLAVPANPSDLKASIIAALNRVGSDTIISESIVIPEYFIRHWLLGDIESQKLSVLAVSTGIKIDLLFYNIVLLKIAGISRRAIGQAARNVEKKLKEFGDIYMFHDMPGEYAFVVGGDRVGKEFLLPVIQKLGQTPPFQEALWSVGEAVPSWLSVSNLYEKSLTQMAKLSNQLTESDENELMQSSFVSDYTIEQHFSPLIQHAVDIINREFRSALSLNIIAQRLNASTNYLGFLFHQDTGAYFSDYLNSIRISEAKHLLRDTDESIDSIPFSQTAERIARLSLITGSSRTKKG